MLTRYKYVCIVSIMETIKILKPSCDLYPIPRATGYLLAKLDAYMMDTVCADRDWRKSPKKLRVFYLAVSAEHFLQAIRFLYSYWRHGITASIIHATTQRCRDFLSRVFQKPKGLNT